jgi:HEAT repeat protein
MALFGPPNVIKLESKQDVKGLIQALCYHLEVPDREKYEPLRQAAVDALVRIGQPAVRPLMDKFRSAAGQQKESITQALVRIGSPAVPELIETMLENRGKHNYKPYEIAEILRKIGDPRAIEPLIAVLTYPPISLEGRVLDALRDFGAQAVEPLRAVVLNDPNMEARRAAASALQHIGLPALDALVDAFMLGDENICHFTALTLAKLGPSVDEALLTAYRTTPVETRCLFAAYVVFGSFGDQPALLAAVMADSDISVREAVAAFRVQRKINYTAIQEYNLRHPAKNTPDVD